MQSQWDKVLSGLMLSVCALPNIASADPFLDTHDDFNLAFLATGYTYREPSEGVKIEGPQFGIEAENTKMFSNRKFARVNGVFSYGLLDYTGSGSSSYNENWYVNVKATVGIDTDFNCGVFSPYIGLGARFLMNDFRGFTDTGAMGYRRISRYYYLPLGARYKIVNGRTPIIFSAEAAYMYQGKQTSKLGDVMEDTNGDFSAVNAVVYGDINNIQGSGYNLNGAMMFGIYNWEVGPSVNYWHVATSDMQTVYGFYEPANHTLEYTFKILRHF